MLAIVPQLIAARHLITSQTVKTLQVVVNDDWLSPPVMTLGSDDVLHVSFDELSHEYHRFTYRIEHCDVEWNVSEGLFESDYIDGFNNNPIEQYHTSRNTTILYTHYDFQIPNERCSLKMSGNYRLTVCDEDNDGRIVCTAEFMVVEPLMRMNMEVATNTDIDVNDSHQQLSLELSYMGLQVTNINGQIRTVVAQNGRQDNAKRDVRPNMIMGNGLKWTHNKELIFDAGNEYHKYEILALSHPTMGIESIDWNGHTYDAYPFVSERRANYLYDESAKGAFYIRNSDNIENETTCDYVYVHYKLKSPRLATGNVVIDGWWTTDGDKDAYVMSYDEADGSYNAVILQKQGYYSYQYLLSFDDGTTNIPPTEGSFYQTKNRYQAYVYYKGRGGRAWRLVGYRQLIMD